MQAQKNVALIKLPIFLYSYLLGKRIHGLNKKTICMPNTPSLVAMILYRNAGKEL